METEGLFPCWEESDTDLLSLNGFPDAGYRVLKIPVQIFSLGEMNWFSALVSTFHKVEINFFPI